MNSPAWVERAIRAEVTADPAVLGLVELYTMSLGPRAVLAVLGVTFARDLSAPEVAAAVERLQQRVIGRLDGLTDRRLVVIEPTPAPAGRRTPPLAAPTSGLARRSAESSSRRHPR